MQREQLEQLLSSNSMLIHFSDVIFEGGQRGSFFHVTRNRTPYLWAHIPERVLSKGDCVESGYSEVMIAQFILNCRLFKESAKMRIAMSCSRQLCRSINDEYEMSLPCHKQLCRWHHWGKTNLRNCRPWNRGTCGTGGTYETPQK